MRYRHSSEDWKLALSACISKLLINYTGQRWGGLRVRVGLPAFFIYSRENTLLTHFTSTLTSFLVTQIADYYQTTNSFPG